VLSLIGDAGLNNCRGIDFNSEGKLKALCETGQVDYIVELQNEEDREIRGIALRQRAPATVPTLSEWGLIATAVLLLAGALYFLRRRGLSIQI